MIYQINKKLHKTFSVFEKNKLPGRAYMIPYRDKKALEAVSIPEERYRSDMVEVLSGEWEFKLYKSISALPDKLDTLKAKFDAVNVPSDWQRTGYLPPVYLNCPYEFETIPPEIPEDMPVGVYRKFFGIEDPAKTYILSFLGVANNLALYLNGEFVGYSEGSHNTAEFDLTGLVREGKNEMLVVSFKWCNGTFLECQDMFRENGIFRDVLLYRYDAAYLYDYEVKTKKQPDGAYTLCVETETLGDTQGAALTAALYDGKKAVAKAHAAPGEALDFGALQVTEWNPEVPKLYTLYITLKKGRSTMTVRCLTGFRTVEIRGSVFYFNDRPIKIKGVNHHDSNQYNGYVMTFADYEADVKLMKRLNVNAIRTSHYPPDPCLLTLADIYGLYIIDEADIETHGCGDSLSANDFCFISKDIKWKNHYVDRVARMFARDKNHPCVTMWSLGNEAGGYQCQDACYKYLKTVTDIPVHYESVVHTKRFCYDVVSEMYTSTEDIELMMKHKRKREVQWADKPQTAYNKKPFFLCEYCHAMGVGPGNLEEYWELIYKWDTAMGGCIWEWCDHTVYHPDGDKKYKYRYTYGGDHKEKRHDGHFCVDGLVYADRRLHTGAKEMRVVYRPVRASHVKDNTFRFENTNRFRSSGYLKMSWTLLQNGIETAAGELKLDIAPMQTQDAALPLPAIDKTKDAHLNITYTDENGIDLATEQLTLNDAPLAAVVPAGKETELEWRGASLTVRFDHGEVVFNTESGAVCSYVYRGKELLAAGKGESFTPVFTRADIDNDAANLDRWKKLRSLEKRMRAASVQTFLAGGDTLVSLTLSPGGKKIDASTVFIDVYYRVTPSGAITASFSLFANREFDRDVPRFGFALLLDRSFDRVTYYGRGEAENMPDFKCQAPVGIYSASIADLHEPYVYPQNSGMHCDVKHLALRSDNVTLNVYAAPDEEENDRFAFGAQHFTEAAVQAAKHQEDLHDMDLTYVSIDGKVRGIGSSSCGPDTRKEYRLSDEFLSFSTVIVPEESK